MTWHADGVNLLDCTLSIDFIADLILNFQEINKILLCICDGMNIAFNGFYNFVFSIVSSLSDF